MQKQHISQINTKYLKTTTTLHYHLYLLKRGGVLPGKLGQLDLWSGLDQPIIFCGKSLEERPFYQNGNPRSSKTKHAKRLIIQLCFFNPLIFTSYLLMYIHSYLCGYLRSRARILYGPTEYVESRSSLVEWRAVWPRV